jgi:hypothetical protein
MQCSKLSYSRGDGASHARGVRYVARDGSGFAACTLDFSHHSRERFRAASCYDDAGAFPGKRQRAGPADAGAATGD